MRRLLLFAFCPTRMCTPGALLTAQPAMRMGEPVEAHTGPISASNGVLIDAAQHCCQPASCPAPVVFQAVVAAPLQPLRDLGPCRARTETMERVTTLAGFGTQKHVTEACSALEAARPAPPLL